MEPKTKKLVHYILVVGLILIVVLAIILAIVLSSKKDDEEKNKESGEEEIDIVNSYNNTEELIKKFPVGNPTKVLPGLEEKIQNRLLTGFENWNRGFKAWKAWGNILYTNDSSSWSTSNFRALSKFHGCNFKKNENTHGSFS